MRTENVVCPLFLSGGRSYLLIYGRPLRPTSSSTKRYYPIVNRYYQKKLAQTNEAVAIKAISNKLARASYYILRDQVAYDEIKLFGGRAEPVEGLVNNRKG